MSDSVSFESGSHLHVYIAHMLQHVNLIFLLNPILTYNEVVSEESDKSLCLPGLTLVVTLSFMHPPSHDIDHVPSLMKLKDMVRERLRDSPGPM